MLDPGFGCAVSGYTGNASEVGFSRDAWRDDAEIEGNRHHDDFGK